MVAFIWAAVFCLLLAGRAVQVLYYADRREFRPEQASERRRDGPPSRFDTPGMDTDLDCPGLYATHSFTITRRTSKRGDEKRVKQRRTVSQLPQPCLFLLVFVNQPEPSRMSCTFAQMSLL